MFEKEAEEYADKSKPSFVVNEYGSTVYTLLDIEQAFQKGAEFGYNKAMNEVGYRMESAHREGVAFGKDKANEEMQEQGLALQSDMNKTIEQNIALKKQIEKLEKLVPKTCENCVGYSCHAICVDCDFKDKWEIK